MGGITSRCPVAASNRLKGRKTGQGIGSRLIGWFNKQQPFTTYKHFSASPAPFQDLKPHYSPWVKCVASRNKTEEFKGNGGSPYKSVCPFITPQHLLRHSRTASQVLPPASAPIPMDAPAGTLLQCLRQNLALELRKYTSEQLLTKSTVLYHCLYIRNMHGQRENSFLFFMRR